MSRSIIISFLLQCGLALSRAQTLESADISVTKILHSRDLFTAKLDEQIFSLTWTNETHLEVFSTNQTEASNQSGIAEKCTFDVRQAPFNRLNSSKTLGTTVLGAGNKIAALGFRRGPTDSNNTRSVHNYYDVFLLDLTRCEHKMVKTAYLDDTLRSRPRYEPQIVAYNDSFDVFFADGEGQKCTPCRYNSEGEKIELEHGLEMDFDEEFSYFHVRLLDSAVDTRRTYFYVANYRNESAVMELLDRDFGVVKRRYVDYEIPFVSVNKDVGSPVGYCYFSDGMYCERIDFYLNPVLEPLSITIPDNNEVLHATVTLDTLGNTFVGVLHAPLNSAQRRLAVFRYDRYGWLAEALDLGDIDYGNRIDAAVARNVRLDAHIVEGMQGQYCLFAYEVRNATAEHHNIHVKCIQAPKDDENR